MAPLFPIAFSGLTTIQCACRACTALFFKPPMVVTVPPGYGDPTNFYGPREAQQFVLHVGLSIPLLACQAVIVTGAQKYTVSGIPAAFLNSTFSSPETKIIKIGQTRVMTSG